MNDRFDGRVVLVTGAAQGIGAGIAEAFQTAGAQVEIADMDAEGAAARGQSLGIEPYILDLSDRDRTRKTVDAIMKRHGRIDILINAAGGVRGQTGRPIEAVTEDDWRAIFQANLDGTFWLTQAVAPSMKEASFGRIVNIASGAGLRPSLTGIQAYTAAKHALVGLTKQMSWELGPHGITVNAVAPGLILSNPASQRQWEKMGQAAQNQLLDSLHTKRLGSAEDIANAALFFADAANGWVTGQVLSVDGGRS